MTIRLDYSNMIARPGAPPTGLQEQEWLASRARFGPVFDMVQAQHAAGELGFLDLPGDTRLREQTQRFASGAFGKYADVVLLGIGGSALGPIALRTALRPPGWNARDERARGGFPRLHVLDNVDPITIAALIQRLDLRRTLCIITSKSGGTAETMAQYLIIRARLNEAFGEDARRHLVFVTDPRQGALRAIAEAESIAAIDIPTNVGGRFSVLSPVGLLPAALIGIDITGLLMGAEDMMRRCRTDDLLQNPGGGFAMLQWLAHSQLGLSIHVLMPYSDALRDFAAWFVQLWAESLGKQRLDGTPVGPTPIAALGATDQHSQVQLFMEGPVNKTVTFLAVDEQAVDLEIPRLHADRTELAYLGGHRLGELLDIERQATAGALAARGRPNMTLHIDRVDTWHIGALIMLLEAATAYAGCLYEVNPFDQPGVELGKRFTYAMLGRADAEQAQQEWNMLPKPDPRWSL